VCDIL